VGCWGGRLEAGRCRNEHGLGVLWHGAGYSVVTNACFGISDVGEVGVVALKDDMAEIMADRFAIAAAMHAMAAKNASQSCWVASVVLWCVVKL